MNSKLLRNQLFRPFLILVPFSDETGVGEAESSGINSGDQDSRNFGGEWILKHVAKEVRSWEIA